MSNDNQKDTEQIALMIKELEGIRERTEQVANIVDFLRLYVRVIRENAQSALITGDMDDLLRKRPLPVFIESDVEMLEKLGIGIRNGADLVDILFRKLAESQKEDEE